MVARGDTSGLAEFAGADTKASVPWAPTRRSEAATIPAVAARAPPRARRSPRAIMKATSPKARCGLVMPKAMAMANPAHPGSPRRQAA
jgi:hypothetical protein